MASNYLDLAMCAYSGDAVADPAKVAGGNTITMEDN